jgi:hypothetical protein
MEPPKSEGERWRRMPLSKIADAAMDDVTETQKKASIELQRRLIHALLTFHEESERSSERLLRATWAIVALTVVLAGLTAALIVLAVLE